MPTTQSESPAVAAGLSPGASVPPTVPDPADLSTHIGELFSTWLGIKFDEVDAIIAEGRSRTEALPDLRHLWGLFGELVIRLHAAEQEIAELKRGRR